jgi:hypothetical protein
MTPRLRVLQTGHCAHPDNPDEWLQHVCSTQDGLQARSR